MKLHDLILPVTSATLWTALQMVLGFFGALFLGAKMLPGIEREGYPLADGSVKEYKLTGMTLFFVTHIVLGALVFGFGVSLTPVIRHFWSLFIVANGLAIAISLWLFVRGRKGGTRPIDLWLGNELNPTWWGVDLKMFMYQPSLIGVNILVASFACAQRDLYGSITPQTACMLGFWWCYLFTHYVKEEFMLSTWDIIAENFGFMLVWGDLVYVPFLYSLPCFWLVDQTTPFATWQWVSLSAACLVCIWVFREANWQKERYKRRPDALIWGKKPELVGGRLLASGFWGIGRKLNYTGEIGVYICFALTTGLGSPYPYILPLSLLILLAQRAHRDDRRCAEKYGPLWDQYRAKVRFRMIPFLY